MIDEELKNIQLKFLEMDTLLKQYRSMEGICPLDDLAQVLKKERNKQQLTLRDLAELSGVSYATLVKLESGDDRVNLKILKQVAKVLGVRLWIG